jgi:hypothetical protein
MIVREVFQGPNGKNESIAFHNTLPPGTTQGDILCLVRRRDEVRILQARELASDPGVPEGKIHGGQLYLPSGYMNKLTEENNELKAQVTIIRDALLRAQNEAQGTRRLTEENRQLTMRISELINQVNATRLDPSDVVNIARRYRQEHLNDDCSEQFRCSICEEYDMMTHAITERATSTRVSGPRRRIKSSSSE